VWDQSAHLNSGAYQLQCHTAEHVANERISTLHNDAVSSIGFIQRRLSLYHVTTLFHLRINNRKDASSIQNFILSRNSTSFGHLLCPSSDVSAVHVAIGMFHAGYVAAA
jgi:hypothetical protein